MLKIGACGTLTLLQLFSTHHNLEERKEAVIAKINESLKDEWVAMHYHSMITTLMMLFAPRVLGEISEKILAPYAILESKPLDCQKNSHRCVGIDWHRFYGEKIVHDPTFSKLPFT